MEKRDERGLARLRPQVVATRDTGPGLADMVRRVGDDFSELAKSHVELAKVEVGASAKRIVADAAGVVLGGVVALIGLALLCISAVAGAEPLIPELWLRMLLGAALYILLGSTLVYLFVNRLRGADEVSLDKSKQEIQRTAQVLKQHLES